MDIFYQYAPLVVSLIVGVLIGGYAVSVAKVSILPKDMDKVVSIAVSAITQAQQIYGDNTLTNGQKAREALSIATLALQDAGISVNGATLALIIKVAYHALKPDVKRLQRFTTDYTAPDHK